MRSSHGFGFKALVPAVLIAIVIGCQSGSGPGQAIGRAHRVALEDTLRRFADTLLAAENDLNAARAAELSDDVEPALTVLGQDEFEMSQDSLRRSLTAGYASVDSNIQTFDGVRARVFTVDLGSIVAHGRSRVHLKDGTVMRQRITGTFLVVRRPTGWKIVQSHITGEADSTR